MRATHETVDPRIRRTRQLLHEALEKLLKHKDFDKMSIQDIAEGATVNRVTFYDHYTDKFALLESMVESRLNELLAQRDGKFRRKMLDCPVGDRVGGVRLPRGNSADGV